MKVQLWFEAEVPGEDSPDEMAVELGRSCNDATDLLLVLTEMSGGKVKVIASAGGARVLLPLHPELYCPICQDHMVKRPSGTWLFECQNCGHMEGRVTRLRVV